MRFRYRRQAYSCFLLFASSFSAQADDGIMLPKQETAATPTILLYNNCEGGVVERYCDLSAIKPRTGAISEETLQRFRASCGVDDGAAPHSEFTKRLLEAIQSGSAGLR